MDKTETKTEDAFRQAIRNIVKNVIEEEGLQLAHEDIQRIVHEAMPDFDRIISNKIQEHLYQIGNFLSEKFKTRS
jgi:uncharacterized protein YpuA (DUF1002 family)